MAIVLDEAERAVLAAHDIALFEDRPIRDAHDPIDDETIAFIEARIGCAIPEGLLALWRVTFGGRLDYTLRADVAGESVAFSFQELFARDDGASYRDLMGWIEHEEALAHEVANASGVEPGKLDFLPFGGFEHLDRLYVKLTGEDRGAVYAWKHGFPHAVTFATAGTDAVARVAGDVPSLFRHLAFERDPVAIASDFGEGLRLLSVLADLTAQGTAGASAAEKILGAIAAQTLDWRPALAGGSIVHDHRLRDLAIEAAAESDDLETFERLAALGTDFSREVLGGATALERAIAAHAWRVARFLLDRGASAERTIAIAATHASPELVAELLIRGGEPSAHAALAAAADGHAASAALIARAALARDPLELDTLIATARGWAQRAEDTAARIEAGRITAAREPADYRREAESLRNLAGLAPSLTQDTK